MTPVGAAPQVSDDLIDLVHLHAVEFHDGSEENKKKIKAFPKAQRLMDLMLCHYPLDNQVTSSRQKQTHAFKL